jgi:PhoH-like ATPase
MAIKTYILDTNVLLQSPDSIYSFEDNNVIIPIGVIEELDKFKRDQTELGRNARQVSRSLDALRENGDLKSGVKLQNGGLLKVRYNGNLEGFYKEQNVDLHVIRIAQETVKHEPNIPCIIVTKDVNIRIRANALGLKAENYERNSIQRSELDKGYSEIQLDETDFEELIGKKQLAVEKVKQIQIKDLPSNYYLVVKKENEKNSILARINTDKTVIKKLISPPKDFFLSAKNKEQAFLLDALFDKDIKLVSVAGKAGSGKTLLSVAVGHYLTLIEKQYKRLLVSRPVYPMGKDIGFIPGEILDKLDPYLSPIYDALDIIYNYKSNGRDIILENPNIVVEPLTYIRGRSIHNQILLVDEAQNLTSLEIKTIITRAGENTKIVLTGDIEQIDNPYVDSLSNGLSIVMAAFRNSPLSTSLILEKGVRSLLAEAASKLL